MAINAALEVPYMTVGEPKSSLDLELSQRPQSSYADEEANDQILTRPQPQSPTEHEYSPTSPTTPTKKNRFSMPDNIIVPKSRRSSLVSLRGAGSIAEPSATVLIRRAAPVARLIVERGLLDVMSDLCLSARFHASAHGIQLWQAPLEPPSPNFTSTFGIAAKNRLTKRDSILVRAKSHRSIAESGISSVSIGDMPRQSNVTESIYTPTSPPSYKSTELPIRAPMRSASETALPIHLRQQPSSPTMPASPPLARNSLSASSTSRRAFLPNRKSLRSLLGIKPSTPKVVNLSLSYDYYIPPATTPDSIFKRWTGSLNLRRPSYNARLGDGRPSH